MKWIVRNNLAATTVHTELWLDEQANNTWSLVTSFDDSAGAWPLSSRHRTSELETTAD